MRLPELPLLLIEEKLKSWRRRAIVGAIALVGGIVALGEGLSAARIALEPVAGPAGSRLVIALVFIAVIVAACAFLWMAERGKARPDHPRAPGDQRIAAIAEAIHVGYGLAQDLRRSRTAETPAGEAERAASARARGAP